MDMQLKKGCATSILQDQKVADVVEIAVTSNEEVDAFIGTCIQTNVINYLCSELPVEAGSRAIDIKAGDFALVYDDEEQTYARNFILGVQDGTVEVRLIVFLTTRELVPRGHKPLFVPFSSSKLLSKMEKE